jgi:hypothetical protein
MSDKEILQHPGDFILDGMLIIGSSGISVEISKLLQELNIFQNIDDPYMSGSILIKDGAGLAEVLPFMGQERLVFSVRTPGRQKIDFNEYHAIIYNVGARVHQSDRSQTIILNFTTLESYKNIRTRVSKSFNGNISTIVQEILTSKKYLGSRKPINIEPTRNIKSYVMPNVTPFDAITIMQEEAVSTTEEAPHYLFYENQDGFHFRSLDSLLGQKKNLSVIEKDTYRFEPPPPGNVSVDPNYILPTILHWEVANNTNSFLNVRAGMYASTLYTHDIFNKNIQKFEFDYIKDGFGKRNSTNQNRKNSGPQVPQTKIGDKPITEYSESRIFVHPTGSKDLHTEGKSDNKAEEWLQESRSRELEREFFTLRIDTYGNTGIQVGDLINVIIPSNKPMSTAEGKDAIDRTLSGRYMITELHHVLIPSSQTHSMAMTVMKDSFENAAVVEDIQIKDEPQGSVDVGLKNRELSVKGVH